MSSRTAGHDDARAIPQRDSVDWDDDQDDAGEVYTVDVRGRGRSGARPGAGPRRSAAGAPPRSSAGPRRPAPPPAETGWDEPRPRRRRRGLPVVALVLLLVAAWVAFMVYTPIHAWNTVTKQDSTPAGQRPAAGKGLNFLLVGSDSRAGLTAAQKKLYSTGSAVGRRTDSIILVHTSSSGGKPVLVSIPRDSYVPIPGHGSNKINAAFSFGGPKLLVQTVENVTGLHIDGYVEIGFAGFAGVVDSVGGVDICVPFHMDDKKAGINLQKGCQTLDGANALGYVRARYSDPRGDIGRAERQRQFLGAIMKKAATPSTVLIPTRYWSFAHAAAAGLIVGQDTSMTDAARVLLAMRAVSQGKGLSLVVPIQSLSYQTQAGDSVKWNTARAKALFTDLREDKPLEAPPPGTDGKPSGG